MGILAICIPFMESEPHPIVESTRQKMKDGKSAGKQGHSVDRKVDIEQDGILLHGIHHFTLEDDCVGNEHLERILYREQEPRNTVIELQESVSGYCTEQDIWYMNPATATDPNAQISFSASLFLPVI